MRPLHRLVLQPRMSSVTLDPYPAVYQLILFACSEESYFAFPVPYGLDELISLASHRAQALTAPNCDTVFMFTHVLPQHYSMHS